MRLLRQYIAIRSESSLSVFLCSIFRIWYALARMNSTWPSRMVKIGYQKPPVDSTASLWHLWFIIQDLNAKRPSWFILKRSWSFNPLRDIIVAIRKSLWISAPQTISLPESIVSLAWYGQMMITRACNFTYAFKDAFGHPRDHGCLCVEIMSQVTDQPSLPISALPMALWVFHALGMIPAWGSWALCGIKPELASLKHVQFYAVIVC